jgi:hypothetical protein
MNEIRASTDSQRQVDYTVGKRPKLQSQRRHECCKTRGFLSKHLRPLLVQFESWRSRSNSSLMSLHENNICSSCNVMFTCLPQVSFVFEWCPSLCIFWIEEKWRVSFDSPLKSIHLFKYLLCYCKILVTSGCLILMTDEDSLSTHIFHSSNSPWKYFYLRTMRLLHLNFRLPFGKDSLPMNLISFPKKLVSTTKSRFFVTGNLFWWSDSGMSLCQSFMWRMCR